MSKGLEALKRIDDNVYYDEEGELISIDKDLSIIEKELRAFDIIRNHHDNSILETKQTKSGQIIHYLVVGKLGKYALRDEEYDLLKEVLL